MKALLYTSDPYEPSGVIGLFETEKQRENILAGYKEQLLKERTGVMGEPESIEYAIKRLIEIDIPIGEFGYYF